MTTPADNPPSQITVSPDVVGELVAKYGEAQRARIERGCRQVAMLWRPSDGDAGTLGNFVREQFAGTQERCDALFERFQLILEKLDGHMVELWRSLTWFRDVDTGPLQPSDPLFAGYDPAAHVSDDLFENKLAFVALLNFPLTTLEDRLVRGESWTRREWAETRLARRFDTRVPADANLAAARMLAAIENYTSTYNIWMHHVLTPDGRRIFPAGKRLISHWGLRDELKAAYAGGPDALARQRLIVQVMDRIVTQTIPASVIDNPAIDWDPVTNKVTPTTVTGESHGSSVARAASRDREPDTRYAMLHSSFEAARLIDPHSPATPDLLSRQFDRYREIPETRVKEMLAAVLESPLAAKVARVVGQRVGRPLEPFDIWYNGLRTAVAANAEELDPVVAARYPNAAAFEKDMPNLLQKLGFSRERADYISSLIAVDASRGSGHAAGAFMRGTKARLRTRVPASGMNYQGYNIATHEFGHNVEQALSINDVDFTLLAGVPNNAFTEAIAFVFQARDLDMLGRESPPDPRRDAANALTTFWTLFEIGGVALLDIEIWHWMYANPKATPAELREGVLGLAREIWNRYYAPIFNVRDVPLLAIYTHILGLQNYTPDYAIGQMIMFQIEEHLRGTKAIGPEIERMVTFGSLAPDLWMKNATGAPVSPDALLKATSRALPEF